MMGVQEKGRKKKRGMQQYIPYDYEAAYSKSMENLHEWFVEQMLKNRKKVVHALKEITAGEQLEIEIYPQFRSMDEVPPEGRRKKKDNSRAQKNLNDKNARKYVERLINQNFTDHDIWITLTYDDRFLPINMEEAIKNMQNYIRRINYQRAIRGLPSAKYVYVTEYDPEAEIRWHHHLVMEGTLDMDTVESLWKKGSRNEVRRLSKDENGLSGLSNYIVKEKNREKWEKRWNSSRNLIKPGIKVVHSKRPEAGKGSYKPVGKYVEEMVRSQEYIKEQLEKWYKDYDFTCSEVYYNDFNGMFYIHARMRKRRKQNHDEDSRKKFAPAISQGRLLWVVHENELWE